MGNPNTDHTKRKQLRRRLEEEGLPAEEISDAVAALKAQQQSRRLGAPVLVVPGQMASYEVLTPSVTAVVVASRLVLRDPTAGNRQRLGYALEPFDGLI